MDETFVVSLIIDKLPPSCKDFRNTLMYIKDEINIEKLGSHIRIEEGIQIHDGQKDANPNPTIYMV